MNILPPNRRLFLGGLAVTLAAVPGSRLRASPPAATGSDGFVTLEARPGERQIRQAPAPKTGIWGYNGDVPGPLLRVKKGERVRARLKNGLSQPTSIPWHGVRIANAMDGVAGLTQPAVMPGGTFDYDFVAPDAGTFWYHPHSHEHTGEQLDRGLYGLLIVDEPTPPTVDADIAAVIDDWRLEPNGQIEPTFGAAVDAIHEGRLGNILTINSVGRAHETVVRPNSRVRIRLVNVANARVFALRLEGATFAVVAVDGQPATPFAPKGARLSLPPGGRIDLVVDAPSTPGEIARVAAVLPQQTVPLVEVKAEGEARPKAGPFAPLPAPGLPERIDLARARRFDLVMEGGVAPHETGHGHSHAMPNPLTAWRLNKVASDGRSDRPFFSVKRGTSVVITMKNPSAWPHAMHVHGHHFRTLFALDDGWDPFWLDTALVEARGTLRCAFVADNPGKWMIHCHMIEHQAAGMATWFEVT